MEYAKVRKKTSQNYHYLRAGSDQQIPRASETRTHENIRDASHKDVSEDGVGEMKGSSLCTRWSSKGHACLVPRCDFHSTARRLALVPEPICRVLLPLLVRLIIRLFVFLRYQRPTVYVAPVHKENSFSFKHPPFNDCESPDIEPFLFRSSYLCTVVSQITANDTVARETFCKYTRYCLAAKIPIQDIRTYFFRSDCERRS